MSIQEISFYVYGFVSNVICLLGLLGNTLTLYILNASKDMRKQTINIYLTVLTLYDNGVLIFSILMLNLPAITDHYQQQQQLSLSSSPQPFDPYLSNFTDLSSNISDRLLVSLDITNITSISNGNAHNLHETLPWILPKYSRQFERDNDYGRANWLTISNTTSLSTSDLIDRLNLLLFDGKPSKRESHLLTNQSIDGEHEINKLFTSIFAHCFNLSDTEQHSLRQLAILETLNETSPQLRKQLAQYLERTMHLRSHTVQRLLGETNTSSEALFDPMGIAIALNLVGEHECRFPLARLLHLVNDAKADIPGSSHPRPHHHRHKTDSDPIPEWPVSLPVTDVSILVRLLDTAHRYIQQLALARLQVNDQQADSPEIDVGENKPPFELIREASQDDNDREFQTKASEEDPPSLLESYVKFVYPMALLSQTGSIWTTCLITIERYLAVCHPLRSLTLSKRSRAIWALLFLSLAALIFNVPRFWEVDTSLGRVQPSWLRRNKVYYHVYYTCLNLSLNYILPLSLLFYLNIRIYTSVRQANEHRNELTRARQSELHLASMLVAIVAIFIACNAPAFVAHCLEPYLNGTLILDVITISSNVLVCFNSAINFVIYCIFGKKFRRRLKHVLGLKGSRCSRNNASTSTRMSCVSRQFSTTSGANNTRLKPITVSQENQIMGLSGHGPLPSVYRFQSADSSEIEQEKNSAPSTANNTLTLSTFNSTWQHQVDGGGINGGSNDSDINAASFLIESSTNGYRRRCNTGSKANNKANGAQIMQGKEDETDEPKEHDGLLDTVV